MAKVYLDASFLACLFIPNHKFQSPAMILYAQLRAQKYDIYISPLVLDELWHAIFKEKNVQGLIKNGYKDAFTEISLSWDTIKNSGIIRLIQIKKPISVGVEKSLENISQNNFRPRDTFHLATAESQNINEIAAKDSDFTPNNMSSKGFILHTF